MPQESLEKVRIDKWLWAVRICKTRLIATDLCKRQRVTISGQNVKPSREIKCGQQVTVRKDGIDWTYRVLRCISKRVGAKIAVECREDLTDPQQIAKLKTIKTGGVPRRPKGAGRPTKKDRRALDQLHDTTD